MATTADIHGAVILHKSKRMKVIEFQLKGKGGAFVRTKLKDIQSGKIDETFNSGHKLEFIRVELGMQFLYSDNDSLVFMDNDTMNNYQLPMILWGMFKTF